MRSWLHIDLAGRSLTWAGEGNAREVSVAAGGVESVAQAILDAPDAVCTERMVDLPTRKRVMLFADKAVECSEGKRDGESVVLMAADAIDAIDRSLSSERHVVFCGRPMELSHEACGAIFSPEAWLGLEGRLWSATKPFVVRSCPSCDAPTAATGLKAKPILVFGDAPFEDWLYTRMNGKPKRPKAWEKRGFRKRA